MSSSGPRQDNTDPCTKQPKDGCELLFTTIVSSQSSSSPGMRFIAGALVGVSSLIVGVCAGLLISRHIKLKQPRSPRPRATAADKPRAPPRGPVWWMAEPDGKPSPV